MMILSLNNFLFLINNEFRNCSECNQNYNLFDGCQPCNLKHFQNNFGKWTSKNIEIDKILQKVQLDANSLSKVMEWIPYNRLLVRKQIGEGGFGTIYLANWFDGPISSWNIDDHRWRRNDYYSVALKILKNSKNLSNLLKEVSYYFKYIFIT